MQGQGQAEARPTNAHKIVDTALANIDVGPKGKGWVFKPNGRARLEGALEKLFGTEELRHAVVSLVSLAKHFDDRGHRLVAHELLQIASTATQPLTALGSEAKKLAEELGTMTTKVFSAFTATEVTKAAPKVKSSKYGVQAQPGTFSIGAINALSKRRA